MLAWPFQPKQRFLVGLLSSQLFTPLQRLFFFLPCVSHGTQPISARGDGHPVPIESRVSVTLKHFASMGQFALVFHCMSHADKPCAARLLEHVTPLCAWTHCPCSFRHSTMAHTSSQPCLFHLCASLQSLHHAVIFTFAAP